MTPRWKNTSPSRTQITIRDIAVRPAQRRLMRVHSQTNLVMLRVAAPRIPTVCVSITQSQTYQVTICGTDVQIPPSERRLKRHRMLEQIQPSDLTITLSDRHHVSENAAEIQVLRANRGR